jgi:hypothetical protein
MLSFIRNKSIWWCGSQRKRAAGNAPFPPHSRRTLPAGFTLVELLLLIGLFTAATTVLAKPDSVCTVIDPHNPVPTIVIGANCTKSEKFAAEELADHLQQISGRKLEIVDDSQEVPKDKKIIAIGKSKLTENYDLSSLGVEQYIIDVQPERVVILGGREEPIVGADGALYVRDRGTLYGVYDLLEQLGVRWYRPEAWGTYVPSLTTIELPLGNTTSAAPAYVLRSGLTAFQREHKLPEMKAAAELWSARNRSTDTGSDPRYGGRPYYKYSHSYPDLFPPDKYFKEHPEYYALRDGKRDSSRGFNLCLGNPELQKVFAEKIIALAKAHPEWDSFALEPSDGGGKACQCPLCKAMDDPKHPDNESNRLAVFNDIIARQVAAEIPGGKVAWLAYSDHTEVPTVIDRLEPNTIVMPCSINGWGHYSKKLSDPDNANFLKVLQGWYALHPAALMTWEYWSGYGWPGPLPLTRTMADRLRNYRQYNVTGVQNETHPQWGPQGLDLYMYAKLVWNPDLDVDHELELYYQNYYGPAAKPMKAYHETLMNEVEKHDVSSGGRGMQKMMTPELIETLGQPLKEAQELVKGQPLYERRLAGVAAGYEFCKRISQIKELKQAKQETQAEQAFQDLKQYLQGFQEGDAIFDIDPVDKTSDEAVTVPLIYLTLDLGMKWQPAASK